MLIKMRLFFIDLMLRPLQQIKCLKHQGKGNKPKAADAITDVILKRCMIVVNLVPNQLHPL